MRYTSHQPQNQNFPRSRLRPAPPKFHVATESFYDRNNACAYAQHLATEYGYPVEVRCSQPGVPSFVTATRHPDPETLA